MQIDDFLSGRSPLTLALRVGDHMMFVQLQLEEPAKSNNYRKRVTSVTPNSYHKQPVKVPKPNQGFFEL